MSWVLSPNAHTPYLFAIFVDCSQSHLADSCSDSLHWNCRTLHDSLTKHDYKTIYNKLFFNFGCHKYAGIKRILFISQNRHCIWEGCIRNTFFVSVRSFELVSFSSYCNENKTNFQQWLILTAVFIYNIWRVSRRKYLTIYQFFQQGIMNWEGFGDVSVKDQFFCSDKYKA